jgi:hypothetical protein
LTALLWLSLSSAFGQTLYYQVYKGKKSIGQMTIERSQNMAGSVVSYDISTEVRYRVILELLVNYSLNEVFENGILTKGQGSSTINGSIQNAYEIQRNGNSYELVLNNTHSVIDDHVITLSATTIYFNEPKNNQRLFSQHFGRYLKLEEVSAHYYRLLSSAGENFYRYVNGICTEITVIRDFGTLNFNLKPESYVIVNTPDSLRNK